MSEPRGPRRVSLLANLSARVGALILIVVLVVGLLAFFSALRRINEVYDGQLISGANVLRALMSDELAEMARHDGKASSTPLEVDDDALLSGEDRRAFNSFAAWRMFRIWQDDKIVLRSDTGPVATAPPAHQGFRSLAINKQHWRIYALKVPGHGITVEVGEREDIRLVLVRDIALGLALPLLLLAPIIAFVMWLALSGGLKALRALLAELGRRSMRDLSALPLDPWPRDLHPLVRAINRLFERIERALQHERRFLDDAAHQLRTPLTAVKLQAQMIAGETDPVERQALTAELTAGVDRASAMTDSLLTLAKLEAATSAAGKGDLKQETVAVIADLASLAARGGVDIAFEGPDRMPTGDAALLRLVAFNLIENAIQHAPAGSEVTVRLWTQGQSHHLCISDTGSGVPEEERERVLQRFHRGRDAAPGGTGLGLSIVVEALRLLGGSITLTDRDDGAPGLRACVELPQA